MFPSLVGQSMGVMSGTSPKWPNSRLVVKVSWGGPSTTSPFFYVEDANDLTDTLSEISSGHCVPRTRSMPTSDVK